jgi:microcystin-dependent protein
MSFKLRDRVRESSTSTGTGDFALDGAVFGFQAFGTALSDGDTTLYAILQGANWEGGIGRYDASSDALVRQTVLGSSNAGNLVSFGSGLKQVEIGLPSAVVESLLTGNSASATRPTWLQSGSLWVDTSLTPPLQKAYRAATFTVTIASPGVFTYNNHGLMPGQAIKFTTTGALPTGLSVGTTYFVLKTGLATNTFRVSTSVEGSAVNTSGSQSGTHTLHADIPLGRICAGGLSGMVGETKEWNSDTPLPNDGTWLWEDGSNVSRSTYAALFAIVGTTFGVGDGSTTFGIPDSRGRVAANQDGSANRLVTGLTGGVDGDTVGAVGGEDRHVQTSAELFQHTHTIAQTPHSHTQTIPASQANSAGGVGSAAFNLNDGSTSTGTQNATVSNNNTGSSSAANLVQPTIVKKKIIKAMW